MVQTMIKWFGIVFGTLFSACCTRRSLALENLALRQQLALMKHRNPRPRLTDSDRLFWLVLSSIWNDWRSVLHVVNPATVVRWHRQGFRYYWRWKSRRRGRPGVDAELRAMIRNMSRANPLWGAPRIHGELLKLGIEVSQATVSKYMIRSGKPPSQSWRTFLQNHGGETIALDFLTVPTATFRVLFVLVVLSHDRRQILHVNVTAHPTAVWTARQLVEACGLDNEPTYLVRDRDGIYGDQFSQQAKVLGIREVVTAPRSPWQNAYVERVIGSIRRECLDHVIVLGERQLKRVLCEYIDYYNRVRTHLSLDKDAPEARKRKMPGEGRVIKFPRVGGLHHEYSRMAA
jgi:transposase InsO family protein